MRTEEHKAALSAGRKQVVHTWIHSKWGVIESTIANLRKTYAIASVGKLYEVRDGKRKSHVGWRIVT